MIVSIFSLLRRLGASLYEPTDNASLTVGVTLFFGLKLIFVSFGLASMEGPRIGDDSYVYLWQSKANVFTELKQGEAGRSILAFDRNLNLDDLSSGELQQRERVLLRTVANLAMYLHSAFYWTDDAEWSFYAQFWLQEVVVSAFMALGLAYLFWPAPRPNGLKWLLPLLALAFFPLQGIHFLIPSTLALSFGMIAWGAILSQHNRPILLSVSAALAMLAHPIGIAHGGIAGIVVMIRAARGVISVPRALTEAGALLIVLFIYLYMASSGLTHSESMINSGGFGLAEIPANITGLGSRFLEFVTEDPFTALVVGAGIYSMIAAARQYSEHLILAMVLLSISVIAVFYTLRGYPGEVSIRFAVPALVIAFCFAYVKKPQRVAVHVPGTLYLVFFVAMSINTIDFAYGNRDSRLPEVDRNILARDFREIPDSDHILYVNSDIALQAGLIVGGYNHFTSVLRLLMLDRTRATDWLQSNRPDWVVATIPTWLTTAREYARPLNRTTAAGFLLDNWSFLTLMLGDDNDLYIKTSGGYDGLIAKIDARSCALRPMGSSSWTKVELDSCSDDDNREITFGGHGIISGISTKEPTEKLRWPWGGGIRYQYSRHNWFGSKTKLETGSFSFEKIDHRFEDPIISTLTGKLVAYSDRSGLIFFKLEP